MPAIAHKVEACCAKQKDGVKMIDSHIFEQAKPLYQESTKESGSVYLHVYDYDEICGHNPGCGYG